MEWAFNNVFYFIHQIQLDELEKTKIEMEAVKLAMEENKNAAEAPEKEAKDRHEQLWNGKN